MQPKKVIPHCIPSSYGGTRNQRIQRNQQQNVCPWSYLSTLSWGNFPQFHYLIIFESFQMSVLNSQEPMRSMNMFFPVSIRWKSRARLIVSGWLLCSFNRPSPSENVIKSVHLLIRCRQVTWWYVTFSWSILGNMYAWCTQWLTACRLQQTWLSEVRALCMHSLSSFHISRSLISLCAVSLLKGFGWHWGILLSAVW